MGEHMIIDVTIKDNNGTLIHHFIKNLEDGTNTFTLSAHPTGLKTEFKDFLSMYLTESGRVVRERLLPSKYYFNSMLTGHKFKLSSNTASNSLEKHNNALNQALLKYEISFKTLEDDVEEESGIFHDHSLEYN